MIIIMIKENLFIIQPGSKWRFSEYVTDDEEEVMFAAWIINKKRNRKPKVRLY